MWFLFVHFDMVELRVNIGQLDFTIDLGDIFWARDKMCSYYGIYYAFMDSVLVKGASGLSFRSNVNGGIEVVDVTILKVEYMHNAHE